MTVEVHDAPPPTLNFDGADPYEVRGTPFEARAPAPHPPDHLLTHAVVVLLVSHPSPVPLVSARVHRMLVFPRRMSPHALDTNPSTLWTRHVLAI